MENSPQGLDCRRDAWFKFSETGAHHSLDTFSITRADEISLPLWLP